MNIKMILLASLTSLLTVAVSAQSIENDDMYFNSKDRKKLNELKASQPTYTSTFKSRKLEEASVTEEDDANPTDSYSARNVNPEYTSRANSQIAREDNEDYFVNNYQYNRNSNYNNWNNNFNSWYNNSWYAANYWGPGINTWNSPYYGYNSWNSPWYDPYWSYNGWSSSFSFHYGSAWNYGWGGNYNYWNRPYFGWDPYFGYGGSYWNSYRYPNTIVIINNGENVGRGVAYGKRATRGGSIVYDRNNSRSRTNSIGTDRVGNTGGRISNNSGTRQEDYYNRTYRNDSYDRSNSMLDSRTNTQYNRSRSWDSGNSNSSWDNNRSSSPSRSNNSFNSGGATRSHSSGSGSGSNGRTRGRD